MHGLVLQHYHPHGQSRPLREAGLPEACWLGARGEWKAASGLYLLRGLLEAPVGSSRSILRACFEDDRDISKALTNPNPAGWRWRHTSSSMLYLTRPRPTPPLGIALPCQMPWEMQL